MVKHIILKKNTILQYMGLLHVLARHFSFLTELVSMKH